MRGKGSWLYKVMALFLYVDYTLQYKCVKTFSINMGYSHMQKIQSGQVLLTTNFFRNPPGKA